MPQVGRGRLTERLLAQGLLTPNMLQELRREWTQVTLNTGTVCDLGVEYHLISCISSVDIQCS
jgi:hypothetical protein